MESRDFCLLIFVVLGGGRKCLLFLSLFSTPAFEKSALRLGRVAEPLPRHPLLLLASPTCLSCTPTPMLSGGGAGGRARWNGGDSDGGQ